ncbi:hypothetical protein ALC57_00681 [Trachymyrmex cornetzi]|uniref:Helix-turn-helix domain-containing protein n=1 Tax=Trachymyrmex cornetzi TaxID=471704 RepID=A0A151JR97_9HYME|nr:hypothetical protein ALC57_00681 [Trachymyrmex cornetzi]
MINFLDVTIRVEEGCVKIDNYKKPTNSRRYLSYKSHHPDEHKKDVIISQFDRILFLSHPDYHRRNIKNLINVLLLNGYPLNIIFSTINYRIKTLSKRKNLYKNKNNVNKEIEDSNLIIKKYFTIPYIQNISEKFKRIADKNNYKLTYKPINTLTSVIKLGKDKLEKMESSQVVYKINCTNCDSTYVDQTKRKLGTRIKEHKADIKKTKDTRSVVSDHQVKLGHNLDWENIQILDTELFFHKRLTSQMICIKRQINGMNKQTDTEKFPEPYFPLLNILNITASLSTCLRCI